MVSHVANKNTLHSVQTGTGIKSGNCIFHGSIDGKKVPQDGQEMTLEEANQLAIDLGLIIEFRQTESFNHMLNHFIKFNQMDSFNRHCLIEQIDPEQKLYELTA